MEAAQLDDIVSGMHEASDKLSNAPNNASNNSSSNSSKEVNVHFFLPHVSLNNSEL